MYFNAIIVVFGSLKNTIKKAFRYREAFFMFREVRDFAAGFTKFIWNANGFAHQRANN